MRPSVLVAGVGPAGAALAACAARGGVAVVCVEAAGGPEPHSRESDLRPRALEMLGTVRGVPEGLPPRSHVSTTPNVRGLRHPHRPGAFPP